MLYLQVIYRSDSPNARGRNLRTVEVPVCEYAKLPKDEALVVSLRDHNVEAGTWNPVRQRYGKDRCGLVMQNREGRIFWEVFDWDGPEFDPVDEDNPFADRSLNPEPVPPLLSCVAHFEGVQTTINEWAEVLAEINEMQRKPPE